jgi:hypothetical protein
MGDYWLINEPNTPSNESRTLTPAIDIAYNMMPQK